MTLNIKAVLKFLKSLDIWPNFQKKISLAGKTKPKKCWVGFQYCTFYTSCVICAIMKFFYFFITTL